MKIADMSIAKLNFLVAKSLNWPWRYPWLLADEGYLPWRGSETAWGNWHPDYCSSWAVVGPIMSIYGIFPEVNEISRDDNGFVTFAGGFFAKTAAQVLDGLEDGEWGPTPQIAVVRAYLVKTYGKEVDMPGLEAIP